MRISTETGILGALPLAKALQVVQRCGYQYVELSHPGFKAGEATPEEVANLQSALQAAGVQLAAVLALFSVASSDETQRKSAVAGWKHAISVARALGCNLMTSEMGGGSPSDPEGGKRAFRKTVEELWPVLEENRVTIAFECHPGDFLEESNPTIDLLREINCPYVKYLYCTPHTFILGDDIVQMVEYAGPLLAHVHIADSHRPQRIIAATPPKPHEHVMPGWGEVDFPALIRTLRRIGYQGFLSFCAFSHADAPEPALVQTREKLENWLAQW
jgi:myo-inositol catabolism protein IolH